MHAAHLGYKPWSKEVVQHLISSGADLNIQDNEGLTALAHAERMMEGNTTDERQTAVVTLLKNASGKR
jgi:ankyrin repeat protein